MNNVDYEMKLTFSKLCSAMVRNINNNFRSVSFDILKNGNVQVKVILCNKNDGDLELIEDLIAEFASMSETNIVLAPLISTYPDEDHLTNLLYQSVVKGELSVR